MNLADLDSFVAVRVDVGPSEVIQFLYQQVMLADSCGRFSFKFVPDRRTTAIGTDIRWRRRTPSFGASTMQAPC